MFALPFDVLTNGRNMRSGDCKRAIAGLPPERRELCALRLDPAGRGLFGLFHDTTHCDCSTKLEEDMNVIFHGIYYYNRATKVPHHRRYVAMKRFPNTIMKHWFAELGAEDQMDVKLSKRLRHIGPSEV